MRGSYINFSTKFSDADIDFKNFSRMKNVNFDFNHERRTTFLGKGTYGGSKKKK